MHCAVASIPKPVQNPVLYCTMSLYIRTHYWMLLCAIWTLLRELDNNMFYLELQWTCPAHKVRNINTKMESNVRHYMRVMDTTKAVGCVTCPPPSPNSMFLLIPSE